MTTRALMGYGRVMMVAVLQALAACAYSVHAFNADEQYGPAAPYAEDLVIHTRQHVVLGFASDTDYVDEAHRKLLSSCRDGRLFNIQTRHSTALSFLSYENRFTLWATCQRQPPPPPPEPAPVAAPESAIPSTPTPAPPPPKAPKSHHHPHRHRRR